MEALLPSVASVSMSASIVVAVLVIWLVSSSRTAGDEGGASTGSTSSAAAAGVALPLPSFRTKNTSPWFISWIGNPERLKVRDNAIELAFKKHMHGSGSGAAFRANPWKKLPSDTVTLSYDVFFPSTFEWVKGGKLPGVCFGSDPKGCATGGEWSPNEGSFRLMWREDGQAIGYSYMAIKGGPTGAYDIQGTAYKSIVKKTASAGHDLWKKPVEFKFIKGSWNTVSFSIKLNTPGKKDGTLKMTVNSTTKTLNDVIFRESSSVKFTYVIFVSFFGGGSSDWDSPVDTSVRFRNIKFST